ncbi:MAG: rRNA maturation RNase YbeY [Saprospiraceae bacterium]|nr:rRNA maturation RNase YbeY [Pyrinomonadaceae bacterium]
MSEVFNLQRKIKIDLGPLKEFANKLLACTDETDGKTFSIALVSDSRMTELNSLFRGKKSTTDVLSFPHEPDDFDPDKNNLGDLVISGEQAQKQAEENGLTLESEIKQLILHGVLHLCGYDHEIDGGEMNLRELDLRERLGI